MIASRIEQSPDYGSTSLKVKAAQGHTSGNFAFYNWDIRPVCDHKEVLIHVFRK